MNISTILSVAAATAALISTGLSANYDDIIGKGYRWVAVDGPYGCPSKDDLQQITKNRTDETELHMVEQLRAYYLVRGVLVHVVKEDAPSGMTQIQVAGIITDLWTLTSFLSKRPIMDTYGVIETPENSGLIATATTRIDGGQPDGNTTLIALPAPTETPTLGAMATPDASPTP
ncbi:MAG TPA: hypothetical protein VF207_01940 [Chthoniobacterales bacterium]